MITEIIEKNIKAEYLRRYCKQLRDSIEYQQENRRKMEYKERETFDNSKEGEQLQNIENAIFELEEKLHELQKDILNTVLVENGFDKIEGPLYLDT